MRKKKILFTAPLPPPFAGPESSAKFFIESGIDNFFDISVFNTNFRKSNSQKGKIGFASILIFFRFIAELKWRLMTYRPHIVYYYVTATIQGWLFKDIWAIFISRVLGAKVVIHFRASHFVRNYNTTSVFNKWLIIKSLKMCSKILAQSESIAQSIESISPDIHCDFVYNMIKVDLNSESKALSYNPNNFLFLGHLSHAKGYCDILKVIPSIAQKYPNVKFLFAGTPTMVERNIFHNSVTGKSINFEDPFVVFEKYIHGKYEQNYQYLGILDFIEKYEVIANCNTLLLPSYSEGFSMSVLEAIAYSKPIICTPVGAMRDVLKEGENALFVNPGDLKALESAIVRIIEDRDLRDLISKNNLELSKSFSPEVLVTKYLQIFNSI